MYCHAVHVPTHLHPALRSLMQASPSNKNINIRVTRYTTKSNDQYLKLSLHYAEVYKSVSTSGQKTPNLEQKPKLHTIQGLDHKILIAREKRYYFIQLENR